MRSPFQTVFDQKFRFLCYKASAPCNARSSVRMKVEASTVNECVLR